MDYNELTDKFPFLSCIKHGTTEYVGIMQNQDDFVTSMYVYDIIDNEDQKREFLRLGDTWWWESNRKIPITFFLYNDMKEFYPYLMVLSAKNTTIDRGHEINLFNISEKRTKRRTIELVKKQ